MQILPHFFDMCIEISVVPASNFDMYIASECSMVPATDRSAPRIFWRADSLGVPIYALAVSAHFACLNVSGSSTRVFNYFAIMTTILA